MLDQHRLIGAEEIRLILKIVGIIHPPDHFADAAAQMSADELQLREFLENAAHDQPRDRQRIVHRPSDARRKPVIAQPLFAETDGWRMNHDRDIELGRQLEERQALVVVWIMSGLAREDPCAF